VIGTVWKIEKAVGDAVAEGETIMILESMKMEIPVEAPVAGTLTALNVAVEESVEEDQVLCLIES
jgi:biotin carboxyl carrier protein